MILQTVFSGTVGLMNVWLVVNANAVAVEACCYVDCCIR